MQKTHSLCYVKPGRHVSKINIVNVYFDNNHEFKIYKKI
jgi:hypothetical protein